jgi:hypothetical protein
MEQTISVRPAEAAELDQLARLWHDAWRDAHEKLAAPEVTRARTLENFRERLAAILPDVRVAGAAGSALGLCIIKDDELYQLFVAREARGSGVAAAVSRLRCSTMARRGLRAAVSRGPGSRVRSATTAPRGFTRSADG